MLWQRFWGKVLYLTCLARRNFLAAAVFCFLVTQNAVMSNFSVTCSGLVFVLFFVCCYSLSRRHYLFIIDEAWFSLTLLKAGGIAVIGFTSRWPDIIQWGQLWSLCVHNFLYINMCRYVYIVYMGACCWPPVTPSLLWGAALKTGRIQSTFFFSLSLFFPTTYH